LRAIWAASKPGSFLLDRYEVAYLPSLALGLDLAEARTSKQRRSKHEEKLLVVGYQSADLTETAREVEAFLILEQETQAEGSDGR